MGVSVPTFLALFVGCWLAMLGTMASWIGRTPVPGRETDRMISQAWSGGFALLAWIFLAALLLIASSKDVMPVEVGFLTWFALPVSCAAALVAIAVLFKPENHWPAAIPAVTPLLIAGYVLYVFLPSIQTIPTTSAGYTLWLVVSLLSISIVPGAIRLLVPSEPASVQATPGPELDRFKARERQRYRDDVLNQLRQADEETKLYELANLIRPDNPALTEVLDFIRKQPTRQADAIGMLESQASTILPFLADIDLQASPELCMAGRRYLHELVRHRRSGLTKEPNSFVGAEFEEGLPGIQWIARNCGCESEIAEMAAYAHEQQQDAPVVQKFLAALAKMQGK